MSTQPAAWYVRGEDNQPAGPFTAEDLLKRCRGGKLDLGTLCWREGMPQWLPLNRVRPFASALVSVPANVPPGAAGAGKSAGAQKGASVAAEPGSSVRPLGQLRQNAKPPAPSAPPPPLPPERSYAKIAVIGGGALLIICLAVGVASMLLRSTGGPASNLAGPGGATDLVELLRTLPEEKWPKGGDTLALAQASNWFKENLVGQRASWNTPALSSGGFGDVGGNINFTDDTNGKYSARLSGSFPPIQLFGTGTKEGPFAGSRFWRGMTIDGSSGLTMPPSASAGSFSYVFDLDRLDEDAAARVREWGKAGSVQVTFKIARVEFERFFGALIVRVENVAVVGPGDAVPELIAALQNKDADARARSEAAQALGHLGPAAKEAVPVLTDALRDKDVNVRIQAAKALGELGPAAKAAVPALKDPLAGEIAPLGALGAVDLDWLKQAAREALKKIDPEEFARVETELKEQGQKQREERERKATESANEAVERRQEREREARERKEEQDKKREQQARDLKDKRDSEREEKVQKTRGPLSGDWRDKDGHKFHIDDDETTVTIKLAGYDSTFRGFTSTLTRRDGKSDSFEGTTKATFQKRIPDYSESVTATLEKSSQLELKCPKWPNPKISGKTITLNVTLTRAQTGVAPKSVPAKRERKTKR